MSSEVQISVGGGLAGDLDAFRSAWRRAETGEILQENFLSFESWDALSKVLSGERIRLMRHVHSHPERSVNALATALKRQYRRVHQDVQILERAGLLDRSHGDVRAAVDGVRAEVTF